MQDLPDALYNVDSVAQLEQIAINQFGIPAYELMKRAGHAVFHHMTTRFSPGKNILVLTGAGNNAGDGYVVARLALEAGMDVTVCSMIDPRQLKGDAAKAYTDWQAPWPGPDATVRPSAGSPFSRPGSTTTGEPSSA